MTPFAVKVLHYLQNFTYADEVATTFLKCLCKSVCYDMTALSALVDQCADSLNKRFRTNLEVAGVFTKPRPQVDPSSVFLDHGGLFVWPAVMTWIELSREGERYGGLLVERASNRLDLAFFAWVKEDEIRISFGGMMAFLHPNDTFVILPDDRFDGYRPNGDKHLQIANVFFEQFIAALFVLNAPYGTTKETVAPHKGRAKQARKAGWTLRPHHVIHLSKEPPPEHAIKGVGSSKQFHFVRSHRRRLTDGKSTVVKAHFRGDPRLGILSTSYEVRE